jgi:hypothetical protein
MQDDFAYYSIYNAVFFFDTLSALLSEILAVQFAINDIGRTLIART